MTPKTDHHELATSGLGTNTTSICKNNDTDSQNNTLYKLTKLQRKNVKVKVSFIL